jgi:hypothetical protein
MNERTDEANVPRGPWQRLLEDSAEGPPETTDARIRAAARRDLTPRGQRWWLPASLAASFVLAVLIVRSEIGSGGRVAIRDTERGGDAAIAGRIVDRQEGPQAREPGESPKAAAAAAKPSQREIPESDAYGYADSELGQEEAGTGPLVGGPERELQSASERPEERVVLDLPEAGTTARERAAAPAAAPPESGIAGATPTTRQDEDLGNVVVTGSRRRAEEAPAPTAPSAWTKPHVAAPVDSLTPLPSGALATPPTPEAWYAAIEKLRREGRKADAERELARLEKAYPGWLEAYLKRPPPPP